MFHKRLYFLRLLAAWMLLAPLAPRSFAHPMGNFSVNHYSKISLENDGVRISYIIDLAEIPTYQELQQGDISANAADPAAVSYTHLDVYKRQLLHDAQHDRQFFCHGRSPCNLPQGNAF